MICAYSQVICRRPFRGPNTCWKSICGLGCPAEMEWTGEQSLHHSIFKTWWKTSWNPRSSNHFRLIWPDSLTQPPPSYAVCILGTFWPQLSRWSEDILNEHHINKYYPDTWKHVRYIWTCMIPLRKQVAPIHPQIHGYTDTRSDHTSQPGWETIHTLWYLEKFANGPSSQMPNTVHTSSGTSVNPTNAIIYISLYIAVYWSKPPLSLYTTQIQKP